VRVYVQRNRMTEWSLSSGVHYTDPFNDVRLDAVVVAPSGAELRVPSFWAGDNTWRIRFSSPELGTHRWRTECDQDDSGLGGREGVVEVTEYAGDNPLYARGPVRASADGTHLEHVDGTPFFWLADTWWMGLARRLRWPEDLQRLCADRTQKGFSVVQIVAGLYPDMPAFDPRCENEAGQPWGPEFARVSPAYWDAADLRIQWLVDRGIVPAVVGCWGYYIEFAGEETLKKHWRYIIARWGALPIVWCLCGEAMMPYYLSEYWGRWADYAAEYGPAWARIGRFVRETDPFHRAVCIHPTGDHGGRDMTDDELLDFEWLQTGHSDRHSFPGTVQLVREAVARKPRKPVVNSEVTYEGILGANGADVQRLMFWACMLSGACGHTYGANGIWQMSTASEPYGPSPHGSSWGETLWEEAYRLPGSAQLALGKRLLERFRWWEFEPHPEWATPHSTEETPNAPFAAGIPGKVRVVYIPLFSGLQAVEGLEPGARYVAYYFNPKDGYDRPIGPLEPDASGRWTPPPPPVFLDWVLVLEAPGARPGESTRAD